MASTSLRVAPAAGLAPCRRARASRTVCAAEPSRRVLHARQAGKSKACLGLLTRRLAGLACRRARHSRRPPARLWTPTSARPAAARLAQSSDANTPLLSLSGSASAPIVARRGEEAPNPMVMERFQSVISSLFSQVRRERHRLALAAASRRRALKT